MRRCSKQSSLCQRYLLLYNLKLLMHIAYAFTINVNKDVTTSYCVYFMGTYMMKFGHLMVNTFILDGLSHTD